MTQPTPKRGLTDEEIHNRFGYHPPASNVEVLRHEELRSGFIAFCEYLNHLLPDGRAKSSAMTKLQECSMWAHFGVAELSPVAFPKKSDEDPNQITLFNETPVNDETVPRHAE